MISKCLPTISSDSYPNILVDPELQLLIIKSLSRVKWNNLVSYLLLAVKLCS
jgi:hypothetical protein